MLLIRNGALVTLDEQGTVYRPGWLAVAGDRIAALGPGEPPERLAGAERVIDAAGMAVLPGLVNGHTHLEQIYARGLADGQPLLRWLEQAIWPLEDALTPEEVYLAARVALLEQLRCGVTAVVDHHKVVRSPEHVDAVAQAAAESGMRLLLARLWADLGPRGESADTILDQMARLRSRWHGAAGGRITVGFGPTVPWRCSDEAMQRTVRQARAWGLPTHIHIAESRAEVARLHERVGKGHVAWLEALGVLGPDVHLVHSIWLDEEELDLVARRGAVVVHCPTSNAYLASGVAPVRRMLQRGIPVALGTDGAGGGGAQDMLETTKMASYLAKLQDHDPTALPAVDALRMATNAGARLFERADLGRLAAGCLADLTLVRLDTLRAVPACDPTSAVVYSALGPDVHTVIVGGRILLDAGQVPGVDVPALIEECAETALRVRQRITTS